jgi:hypothetical protein
MSNKKVFGFQNILDVRIGVSELQIRVCRPVPYGSNTAGNYKSRATT